MNPRIFRLRMRILPLFALSAFACIGPTSSARAQFSQGHDSFVGYPQSQSYWAASGYSTPYTDQSTQVHAAGTPEPYRGLAPYIEPPYGQYGRANGLAINGRPATVATVPARAAVPVVRWRGAGEVIGSARAVAPVARRRGLFGRMRGR